MNFRVDFNVLPIISYVLLALGLYTMAKRRGIRKPWLAWIPVANLWLLGCLSDQYQFVVMGQQKNRRKVLLTLTIIVTILSSVMIGLLVAWFLGFLNLLVGQISPGVITDLQDMTLVQIEQWAEGLFTNTPGVEDYMMSSMGLLLGSLIFVPLIMGFSIWLAVVQYMAYYDLFRSSNPRNASLFLTLGIVLNMLGLGIVMSVFVFICRDKDLGMPPRQDEAVPPPPVWTPPAPPTEPFV